MAKGCWVCKTFPYGLLSTFIFAFLLAFTLPLALTFALGYW